MIIQPILGWWHHKNYLRYERRTAISHAHLWYGRALMIIGIVNGGIGLQLSGASTGLIIAYAVVSIIVFAMYTAGSVRKMIRMRRKESRLMSDVSSSALELT